MRRFIGLIAMLLAADGWAGASMTSAPLVSTEPLERIAFGSCAHPRRDTSVFHTIAEQQPDLFLLIGDNVYADDEKDDPELASLKLAYKTLADSVHFARLRETAPLLVSWDDHDYGLNDAGGDWPHKHTSQALFVEAWGVAANDERRSREGIYHSRMIGPEGKRVQVILLDTRFFRSALRTGEPGQAFGPYRPDSADDKTLLGEDQWRWLAEELAKPAELRIIASSIQIIAEGHNWEAWNLFPQERQRLYDLIEERGANGVVFVSGDRHMAGIYQAADAGSYPLWEITSSSLNLPLSSFVSDIKTEPGPRRLGAPYYEANFGMLEVDWDERRVILQVRDDQNRTVRATSISLQALTP